MAFLIFIPMTYQQIENKCEAKVEELLEKYFGNLVSEAAVERPETIGNYSLDLPEKIEAEFAVYLKGLWTEIAPADSSFEEIIDKRELNRPFTDSEKDTEMLQSAYRNAMRQSLVERLARTNHEDVTFYKGLLRQRTKRLLTALECDFLEDVAKLLPPGR